MARRMLLLVRTADLDTAAVHNDVMAAVAVRRNIGRCLAGNNRTAGSTRRSSTLDHCIGRWCIEHCSLLLDCSSNCSWLFHDTGFGTLEMK